MTLGRCPQLRITFIKKEKVGEGRKGRKEREKKAEMEGSVTRLCC